MPSTLYYRSDPHTVNGQLGFKLAETNTSTLEYSDIGTGEGDMTFRAQVYIRHANGSETQIGTNVAQMVLDYGTQFGFEDYANAQWICPETELAADDAIKIVEEAVGSGEGAHTGTTTFISEQVGAAMTLSGTWDFIRHLTFDLYAEVEGFISFGDASHASRIEGIEGSEPEPEPVEIAGEGGAVAGGTADVEIGTVPGEPEPVVVVGGGGAIAGGEAAVEVDEDEEPSIPSEELAEINAKLDAMQDLLTQVLAHVSGTTGWRLNRLRLVSVINNIETWILDDENGNPQWTWTYDRTAKIRSKAEPV